MLALIASLTLAATTCPALHEAVSQAEQRRDAGLITQAAALLPGPLAERVRGEPGRTDIDGALALLARATALSCPPPSLRPPPEASALQALMQQDGRFIGVRADDVSARLLDRLWAFLEGLLESEGMQRFSEHTRTVYVTLLCFVCAFVAQRMWRRSRVGARPVAGDGVVVFVERRRAAAYAALRAEALALLDQTPREALLLLRRALLARLGEHDEGAVRPSRTSSEVLARLDPRVAAVVAPALQRFDVAFYGGEASALAARALLHDVDVAVAALGGASRGSR